MLNRKSHSLVMLIDINKLFFMTNLVMLVEYLTFLFSQKNTSSFLSKEIRCKKIK